MSYNSPMFEWVGDGPEAREGEATFKVVGMPPLTQRFNCFDDAHAIHSMQRAIFERGAAAGRRAVAQLVGGAVKEYL